MVDKHKKVLEFFEQRNISLPIDVGNAIEDVFNENNNIENIDIYFQEDLEILENDIIITNEVNVYLDRPSSGSIQNIFTYYGDVDYSISEFVILYEKDDIIIESITSIDNRNNQTSVKKDMYAIILIETVEWTAGTITRIPKVYIYCPEESGD